MGSRVVLPFDTAEPRKRDGEQILVQQSPSLTFEVVYAEYRDRIYRYLYRLANGDAATAEDVAQETWLRVYASLGQLQDRSALRGWLYTIAQREWLRANRSPLKTTAMSNQPDSDEIADHSAEKQVDQIAIQQCLARLSEELRSALILVQMEQFTHREAAVILGRPVGTISYQVAEGLRRVRKMLVDDGALAAAAPLGLLESELARWGHQTEPASLHARIRAAVSTAPTPADPSPDAVPPGPPSATGMLRRLLQRRSHRWLAGGAIVLLLLLAALRLPGSSRRSGAVSYPELVLDQVKTIRSLHAVGTYETFPGYTPDTQTSPTREVEYWYTTPPGRYRREVRRPGSQTSAQVDVTIIADGRAMRSAIQPGTGRVWSLPEAAASPAVMDPLDFVDPQSPLCRVMREQGDRLSVTIQEENGQLLRVLTVDQEQGSTHGQWTLHLKPLSGQVVRAEFERFGLGSRGPQRLERVRLNQFFYNPPINAELFTLPAAFAPPPR